MEFERKHPNPETKLITECQFAELLLAYADYNLKKKALVMKRVRKAYKKKKKLQEKDTGDNAVNFTIFYNLTHKPNLLKCNISNN